MNVQSRLNQLEGRIRAMRPTREKSPAMMRFERYFFSLDEDQKEIARGAIREAIEKAFQEGA